MERNVKYHGKQEPRGEVASNGGQREGSPATLSNAPALSDETLLVTCCSMSPKQQLLTLHIPQRTAQALGSASSAVHLSPLTQQGTLDGPASLRDRLGSTLLHQGPWAKAATDTD